jgi:hypothetical protein
MVVIISWRHKYQPMGVKQYNGCEVDVKFIFIGILSIGDVN